MHAHIVDRCRSPLLLFEIKRLREMSKAFFNPRAKRQESRVCELVRSCETVELRIRAGKRSEQQNSTLERGSIRNGKVGRLRLLPARAKPLSNEWRDFFCRVGKVCGRSVMALDVQHFDIGTLQRRIIRRN